jgi:phospholipase/carboxylesterase
MNRHTNVNSGLSGRRSLGLSLRGFVAAVAIVMGMVHMGEDGMFLARAQEKQDAAREGRLTARPGSPSEAAGQTGLQRLELGADRDTYLYVPSSYQTDQPIPLVMSLHGAGGNSHHGLALLQDLAEESGFLLLAPSSKDTTWDMIRGGYGPDVALIDQALAFTFERYNVDPDRVIIAGFSDGASYALSLGIINGDLFPHVLAFSPGYMAPTQQNGEPRFFISHGSGDTVLPIERTSRRIVPQLQRAGYDVRYEEFAGGHTVPQTILENAIIWLTDEP